MFVCVSVSGRGAEGLGAGLRRGAGDGVHGTLSLGEIKRRHFLVYNKRLPGSAISVRLNNC